MRKALLYFALIVFGTSCMSEKYMVSPPFTTVDNIAKVAVGMSTADVNTTLGISPYEVLSNVDGGVWMSYHYRVKEHIIPITSMAQGLDQVGPNRKPESVDDLSAQNSGALQFGDWGTLYVLYVDGVFKSSVSEKGMQLGNELQVVEGSIRNHAQEAPVFMVKGKPYTSEADGTLVSPDRRCRKQRNKRSEQ